MTAVWMRLWAEVRTRWRALLGLTLMVGLAGGLVLAAISGARRTDSANERLLHAVHARDVAVVPDVDPTSLDFDAVERLPQVAGAGLATWPSLIPRRVSSPEDLYNGLGIPLASDGRFAETIDRPKVLEGRLPDPDRAHEVLVNPVLARLRHIAVGDRLRVAGLSQEDSATIDAARDFPAIQSALRDGDLGTPITLHVVGIGIAPEEVVVDEQFAAPRMFLTPAFLRRHPEIHPFGQVLSVRLRGGAAALPAFRRAVEKLANGEAITFQTSTATEAKVDRAVQPQVELLSAFALVVALTGALVAGQAIARYTFVESADSATMSAIGSTRRQLFAVSMLRVGIAAVVGAVLAVVLAVGLSPLTPIGPAAHRRAVSGSCVRRAGRRSGCADARAGGARPGSDPVVAVGAGPPRGTERRDTSVGPRRARSAGSGAAVGRRGRSPRHGAGKGSHRGSGPQHHHRRSTRGRDGRGGRRVRDERPPSRDDAPPLRLELGRARRMRPATTRRRPAPRRMRSPMCSTRAVQFGPGTARP